MIMKSITRIVAYSLFLLFFSIPSFLVSYDEPYLSNVRQLTFPYMGFEKAGEAYFSPDGNSIVFQAVPSGQKHYQIYIMDLQEQIPRMLSTGRGACTCAFFHPDGTKVIFASSHEDPALFMPPSAVPGYKREGRDYSWEFTPWMNIYEASLDGTLLKALTRGSAYHAECAYSSDGEKIVYASNEDGAMNLYVMNSDGSSPMKITDNTFCYIGGPFFCPSGKDIIYRKDPEKQHYLDIYLISADGTSEKRVTNNGAVNWAPYWHPSGQVIAYTTSLHGHHRYEIYLKNIFSGVEVRLTSCPTFDGLPVFHPNGNKIMWTSKRGQDGTCQLFLADFEMPKELL